MLTILSRIVHFGLKNFVRNGLLSTATVAIMTLSLVVFTGLIVANVVTGNMITYIKDKIDVSAYFKTGAPEDQILAIKQSLEKLPEVKSVEYISSDQALEIFKTNHANDATIAQSLQELGANPLEASLNVKAYDPNKYSVIADYLQRPDLQQYVDRVSYSKNQLVIDRLVGIINGVNRVGLLMTILLTLIASLVVFNTIRLVIYSNRDEITIMRSVGASNVLVRGPYIVEGVIVGVLAAVFALVIVLLFFFATPFLYGNHTYFDISVPGFNLSQYFYSHLLGLLGYGLLFGIGVASVSSFFAVRRYLKN